MKKILFVVPSLSQTNGVAAFLINYLKHMDLTNFDIEVLSFNYNPSQTHISSLKKLNIPLYILDDMRENGIKKYLSSLKKFFKDHHDYDVVYSNIANQSIFIFLYCLKYGIKKRVIHSHATVSSDNKKKELLNNIIIKFALLMATNFAACTIDAGKAVFKNKKFTVIRNAINYESFKFNKRDRCLIRKKYGLNDNDILIGFVGRFVPQKNIYFFEKLAKKLDDNKKIIMIGNGYQKKDFIECIKNEEMLNKFIFIDECSNVNKFYSAMDYFCLPSIYEGLGIVGIEAQSNGLITLLSDTIPKDCKILKSTKFLNNTDIDKWISTIKNNNKYNRNVINNLCSEYNINYQSKIFKNYLDCL